MDDADRAGMDSDFLEEASVGVYRELATLREAESTGECLYCQEPLEGGKRWCDSFCRDYWEKEQNLKKQKLGSY